ncbi:hypothetical protein RQM65_06405 [Pricia sp. S334]|uniref:Uncharacterized protein n=1 Tax=Pricia mediterranea TaxID=3076079 RepID=A0ABU3L3H6_9FLAO|nr:hypothetical protein [Pricia sp. S334]MDT7828289.1 hypothetical protein [Pricia sp. S334]
MIKQHVCTLLSAFLFINAGIAQSADASTDSRDGQTYRTISFENAMTRGYFGSDSATDFGGLVPVVSVQTAPIETLSNNF